MDLPSAAYRPCILFLSFNFLLFHSKASEISGVRIASAKEWDVLQRPNHQPPIWALVCFGFIIALYLPK